MIYYLIFVLLIDAFALYILIKDLVVKNDIGRKNPLVYFLLIFSLFLTFYVGQREVSVAPLNALLEALTATRDVFFIKFNFNLVAVAYEEYTVMRIAYLLTILLAYYYVVRLIISLFVRKMYAKVRVHRLRRKPLTVVIGESAEGNALLTAYPQQTILWAHNDIEAAVPQYCGALSVKNFKYLNKYKNVEYVTFAPQEESIHIANLFFESLNDDDFTESNIFLTIVTELNYCQVYDAIVTKGQGLIKVVNKYDIIAKEVIKNYPLSKYLDERFLLPNGLLKSEATIQAVFIGYGKVNEEVYLNTVMNSQFATEVNGNLVSKVVKYHIIEKENKQYNKELNHTLFRIDNTPLEVDDYLPLPDPVHDTRYLQLDINAKEFYTTFNEIAKTPHSKTFVYISIDNDLENLDLVLKLKEHINYFNLQDIILFVRISNYESIKSLFARENGLEDIIIFGSYVDYVNPAVLFDRKLDDAAISAAAQYEKSKGGRTPLKLKPRHNWTAIGVYKQASNRYAILNINFKLNLLGFSLFDNTLEKTELSDFYHRYDTTNERKIKDRLSYDFKAPFNARDVMAFIEHSRWNAFHICTGYIPLAKKLLTNDHNKDMHLKLHACLTTFAGLDEYHDILITKLNDQTLTNEAKFLKVDVKKYDYNTLDELDANLAALNEVLRKK